MDDEQFPKELTEEPQDNAAPAKQFESMYSKVLNMGVSEKIRLATLGNKEARNLLIKDANRAVVQAVMNSPKLSDGEIAAFAANRNLSKEVVRIIAEKKQLLKNYQVKVALVNNPKTPVATALRLVSLLRDNDLKSIAKSKSIPSVIALTARKTLTKRGKA